MPVVAEYLRTNLLLYCYQCKRYFYVGSFFADFCYYYCFFHRYYYCY